MRASRAPSFFLGVGNRVLEISISREVGLSLSVAFRQCCLQYDLDHEYNRGRRRDVEAGQHALSATFIHPGARRGETRRWAAKLGSL